MKSPQSGHCEWSPARLSVSFTPNYELITPNLFLSVMVAAEEVVGPGGGLVQGPVPGRRVAFPEGFFFAIGFEPVVGADVDAFSFPRKDLAPAFHGTSALSVEEILGALRLRA